MHLSLKWSAAILLGLQGLGEPDWAFFKATWPFLDHLCISSHLSVLTLITESAQQAISALQLCGLSRSGTTANEP